MKKKIQSKISNKNVPLTKSLGELMSTVAALGMTTALTDISSGQSWTTHTNTVGDGPADNCVSHTNITTHASY